MEDITIGRQIKEKDVLYVNVPEKDLKSILLEFRDRLSENELEVIDELKRIKSK